MSVAHHPAWGPFQVYPSRAQSRHTVAATHTCCQCLLMAAAQHILPSVTGSTSPDFSVEPPAAASAASSCTAAA